MNGIRSVVVATMIGALVSGCAATQTAISHHELNVQNKMTDTVFLDPVTPDQRTIYIQTRNTSDKPDFNLDNELRSAIAAKGYTITNDFKAAHYLLQVNVLQVGKMDPSAAEQAFAGGFGSTLLGAGGGAMAGGAIGGTGQSALIGGLVGGIVSTVADAAVKNVTYTIITDLQISEKSEVPVQQVTNSKVKQGKSTVKNQTAAETVDKKTYQTRIMSTANQVNLELADAMGPLKAGMTNSIAGIF